MAEEKKQKTALQRRDFDIVIEGHVDQGDYDISFNRLLACLESGALVDGIKYWCIEHNADFLEDGSVKRRHFHIVCRFPTRHRQTAVVKYFATLLDVPDIVVSVAFASVLFRRIRYLMHLDELGTKTLYPLENVKTNDRQTLMNAYNSDSDEVTADYLMSLVASYPRKSDLLRILGVSAYSKYRSIINDLWAEKEYEKYYGK